MCQFEIAFNVHTAFLLLKLRFTTTTTKDFIIRVLELSQNIQNNTFVITLTTGEAGIRDIRYIGGATGFAIHWLFPRCIVAMAW